MAARNLARIFLFLIGGCILLSAAVVNPWTASLYRDRPIHYQDVMLGYFFWSLALGVLSIVLGILVGRFRVSTLDNLTVLFVILASILLLDRLILAKIGLPLWVSDPLIHYRHRPSATKVALSPPHQVVRINAYGHHDDDFPLQKSSNEFRAVMLGDSITMGHGVDRSETYANQLERMLAGSATNHETYQMINAAVQGYSTFQEARILEESLQFGPDFVTIGFCMNDVVEPFVVNRDFGGTGFDYHQVTQSTSAFLSFLLNETGFGRLLQTARSRSLTRDAEVRREVYNVRHMALHSRDDPEIQGAWNVVLENLTGMNDLSKREGLDLLLLIFPYTFQLFDPALQTPQEILQRFAGESGMDTIDFTRVFRDRIRKDMARDAGSPDADGEIEKAGERDLEQGSLQPFVDRYFLDKDHLTVEGHRVVAETLLAYLKRKGMVRLRAPSG